VVWLKHPLYENVGERVRRGWRGRGKGGEVEEGRRRLSENKNREITHHHSTTGKGAEEGEREEKWKRGRKEAENKRKGKRYQ
jgi:hypothetical protein